MRYQKYWPEIRQHRYFNSLLDRHTLLDTIRSVLLNFSVREELLPCGRAIREPVQGLGRLVWRRFLIVRVDVVVMQQRYTPRPPYCSDILALPVPGWDCLLTFDLLCMLSYFSAFCHFTVRSLHIFLHCAIFLMQRLLLRGRRPPTKSQLSQSFPSKAYMQYYY